MNFQPQTLWDIQAELGEGPIWHPLEQLLYFVDIKGQYIHCCAADGSSRKTWSAPSAIGFVQPLADGDFVAGLQDGLYRFSPQSGAFSRVISVDADLPNNRLNDASVDALGRLWFGSMDNLEAAPTGSLYRVANDGALMQCDSDYVITNGPCLSPDGRTLYHTDTLAKVIYAFDVDKEGGLSQKRSLIRIENGYPDGTTLDASGCLWVALFGGGRVERYTPQGERVQTIPFPCPNVTKLAFGGPDLRTALVTTAWKGLSQVERDAQPLAGNLFSFRVDTPGMAQNLISSGFSK